MKNLSQHLKKSHQSGFTLIEVMIALVIFAVGFLAMNSLQLTSINKNAASSSITGSTSWASAQIEDILSWDYLDARLVQGAAITPLTSQDGVYTITWSVTDNTVINNTKLVTITVNWNQMGTGQTTTITTVVPKT